MEGLSKLLYEESSIVDMVVEGGEGMLRLNRAAVPYLQLLLNIRESVIALQPLVNLLGLLHIFRLPFLKQLNYSPELAV